MYSDISQSNEYDITIFWESNIFAQTSSAHPFKVDAFPRRRIFYFGWIRQSRSISEVYLYGFRVVQFYYDEATARQGMNLLIRDKGHSWFLRSW